MYKESPLDRRIQRTRQLLREALFALIVERGYEAITVQDITERANLGRTTLYLHYRDKEELLQASLKTLIDELRQEVELSEETTCPYRRRSIRVFEHVTHQQHLYRALLSEAGSAGIGDLMRAYFADLYQRRIVEPLSLGNILSAKGEMIAASAAGALFGLLSWWLTHDLSPSAEEMGDLYWKLMAMGGEGIIRSHNSISSLPS
jgi:AcrR family transcriptional regulator